MNYLKRRIANWFSENFDIVRESQFSWVIQPQSGQGCFLFLLLWLSLATISVGCSIFLILKVYPIVFSTLMTRLGIAPWLGLPLLIAAFFGRFINLPLFIFTTYRQSGKRGNLEFFPIWLLKCWLPTSYKTQSHYFSWIGLNVSGGLIPIILSFYQFYRVQISAILSVTAIVGLMSYFLVTVIPGRAIVTRWSRFWLITIIAAVSAMIVSPSGVNRLDVSVAFAGGVLGTTIGADLLHLKDVRPEDAVDTFSIGGAGLDDGIAQCGLLALVIAEWSPAAISWLSAHFR